MINPIDWWERHIDGGGDSIVGRLLGPQIVVYNGVAARDRLPIRHDHNPEHKQQLVDAVLDVVEPGDEVVIVGGGRSVVAVHCARLGAEVTVYEAGDTAMRITRSVLELNNVDFEVTRAVVGSPGSVHGELPEVRVGPGVVGESAEVRVDPSSLSGDVLVLDCEGAERDILPVEGFDSVVVETHPRHGATLDIVRQRLPESASVEAEDPKDGDILVA